MRWINKETEIYCSFAKSSGNVGCQIMNTAFYYYGLNKIYKSFSVANIKDAVLSARYLNFSGFAITMPFKEEVLDYVDAMSEEVSWIGAANTVVNNSGKFEAYNTDYMAAIKYLSTFNFDDYDNFYILGDGGYAKAVKCAAEKLNIHHINIVRDNWDVLTSIENSLIYNCTPIENIKVSQKNKFIDCIVKTKTGKELAKLQASYQFKLYTGLEFPL